jgi:hypothetical protein
MARRSLKQVQDLDRKTPKHKGSNIPQCGLCGGTENLTQTNCCGNWICDDESEYRLFSYARNSCSRNHRRLTLCAIHDGEGHEGQWQECQACRDMFETEIYVDYGTNKYNFETLVNPPKYESTRCADCKRVIRLASGGYSYDKDGYYCGKCSRKTFGD